MHTLIPNVTTLERHLAQFARVCSASEVVLFEKSTFLVISRSTQQIDDDHDGAASSSSSSEASASLTASAGAAASPNHQSASAAGDVSEVHGQPVSTSAGRLSPERFEKISELIKNLKSSCA